MASLLATFDFALLGDFFLRLSAAALAGGILGLDRELGGHWAGLRTHMMVSLGAASFALLGEITSEANPHALARVIQGISTGVGFLGAGSILKLGAERTIKGLTTAGAIWLAAALGAIAGLAQYELLAVAVVLAILILVLLRPVSDRISPD